MKSIQNVLTPEQIEQLRELPDGTFEDYFRKTEMSFEAALDEVLNELRATLIYKNKMYGDSFFEQIDRYGHGGMMIPIRNKVDRLDSLHQKGDDDKESIQDTKLDLRGYAVLIGVYDKLRGL